MPNQLFACSASAIEAREVGAKVGSVKNNRPGLMERVGLL
jgi:hypothetical protein